MKKSVLSLVLVVLSCSIMHAQKIKLALQNSIVLCGASSDDDKLLNPEDYYMAKTGGLMPSLRTGVTIQYAPIPPLGIETGILFDLLGYRFSQSDVGLASSFYGNTLNFNIKLPLLAYYKITSRSGGSFFFGGGYNLNYTISGSYRYRQDGKYYKYAVIPDYTENINQLGSGYQVVLGIEDSEYSQLRLDYCGALTSFTAHGNNIYLYSIGLSFIYKFN